MEDLSRKIVDMYPAPNQEHPFLLGVDFDYYRGEVISQQSLSKTKVTAIAMINLLEMIQQRITMIVDQCNSNASIYIDIPEGKFVVRLSSENIENVESNITRWNRHRTY